MAKFDQLAKDVLANVGGAENVSYFAHCTTRLRFNVKDKTKVNEEEIKKIKGVLGCQWSNEEYQIIVGMAVADAYAEICKISGLEAHDAIDEDLDGVGEKKKLTVKSVLMGILDGISGSITPIIPMMIAGGMIKVLVMICNLIGILAADSSTYIVLSWVGDAFTYFFPIYLGKTAAKKFGANEGLGMLLGATLIFPSFIAAVNEGAAMTIFGLPVYMTNYSSTVIPVILTVYVLAKVEKLVNKVCPDMLKSFLVPTCSLIIMIPLMLVVLAPIGYYLGTYVAAFVAWIYNTIGFVGVAVLATLLPWMVMTGMHTMMTPYWLGAFAELGYDAFFMPAMIISNLNQSAACLAVAIKAKNKDIKSSAASCAVTAFLPGVTEPAMFGVTFKYRTPLYAAMIGNLIGGAIAGIMKVACYAFPGSGGIFATVTFVGPAASNLMWFLIAAAVGMISTFVFTLIFKLDEEL